MLPGDLEIEAVEPDLGDAVLVVQVAQASGAPMR
jgi:hypothetical protein